MKHTKILFALVLLFSMLMLSSCGIRTAKYDFELHGDVILSPGYSGTYLYGQIECTVTCVSGLDYYRGNHGFAPARAWLIMPDGTEYFALNPVTDDMPMIKVRSGEAFKTTLHFENLPLDFAPGEYDILVSEYDDSTGEGDYSKKLFEKVTVRFDEEAPAETTPAVQLPPLSESLASEADVKGVGVEMDGVIVEAKRFAIFTYQCCGYNQETGEYYYSPWSEGLLGLYDDTAKLIDYGCPVVKYSLNYRLINNIENKNSMGVALLNVRNSDMEVVGVTVPSEPGFYWMVFWSNYKHPMYHEGITPIVDEWYPVEEQYWVGVIVE